MTERGGTPSGEPVLNQAGGAPDVYCSAGGDSFATEHFSLTFGTAFAMKRCTSMLHGRMIMSEELGMNRRLFDRTVGILGRSLGYRVRNQRVIASNLANIDTPGFRPKKLEFDEELRKAVEKDQVHLTRTDGKHLPGLQELGTGGEQSFEVETEPESAGGDHALDIDSEMAKMAKNNLLYEATVKMLSKKFSLLREAIEERR